MAINKVVYESKTLLDLTKDTVEPKNLLQGATAHDKSGQIITGTVQFSTYYTGAAQPDASLGIDGDLYFKRAQ